MKVSSRMNSIMYMALVAALPIQAMATTPAVTVKLAHVEGNVMINQGVRYVMATPGVELKPGAKVVTAKGASVALVYQDGCIKQLKENSMLTVGSASACTAKTTNERVYLAEAVGDTATDGASPAESHLGGASVNGKFVALGLLLGGAGVALLASGGGSDHNASPQ